MVQRQKEVLLQQVRRRGFFLLAKFVGIFLPSGFRHDSMESFTCHLSIIIGANASNAPGQHISNSAIRRTSANLRFPHVA